MPSSRSEDPRWLVYGRRGFHFLIGFLAPAAVLIGAAVMADSPGAAHITWAEAVQALVAAVVSAAALEVRGVTRVRQMRREQHSAIVEERHRVEGEERHPEAGSSVR